MERNRTLTLVMSPGERLEVLAPDVVAAIAVAREALRYLRGTSYVVSSAAEPRGGARYNLTCLLCGLPDPQYPGRSELLAMQEHLMEAHGFKADDFRLALRVNLSDNREHFIWAFAPAVAQLLKAEQLCYLRVVKLPSVSVQPEIRPKVTERPYTVLVHKSSFDGALTLQAVLVNTQDAYAWYGWPRGNSEGEGEPLVWPKGEWGLRW